MMVRFLAEGEAWSSAPDAGERGCKAGGSSSARPVESSRMLDCHAEVQPILCKESANREQDNKPVCLIVMPRCSLSYAKIGK